MTLLTHEARVQLSHLNSDEGVAGWGVAGVTPHEALTCGTGDAHPEGRQTHPFYELKIRFSEWSSASLAYKCAFSTLHMQ